VRYPNLRYGNPTEMAYYAMGVPLPVLAKRLRRDERTVRDWLNAKRRVPWWVPEILRLKHMEANHYRRQLGLSALAPKLGIVGAEVVALHAPAGWPAAFRSGRAGAYLRFLKRPFWPRGGILWRFFVMSSLPF